MQGERASLNVVVVILNCTYTVKHSSVWLLLRTKCPLKMALRLGANALDKGLFHSHFPSYAFPVSYE